MEQKKFAYGSRRTSTAATATICTRLTIMLARCSRAKLACASASPASFRGLSTSRRGSRSEEHTSELQSLMRISYAVFCLKKKKTNNERYTNTYKLHLEQKSTHT